MSIFSRRIDEIFTRVGEQLFLTGVRAGGGGHLPRVDVHPVLALLGEGDGQRHNVPAHPLTHVLGQLFLLQPVLVEGGHKVCERPRHLELDLQRLRGKDERVLVGEGNEAEKPGGFGRAPLAGRAVGQRHHHRLQVGAHNLELAHRLELHGLPCKIFLGRDGVCKDVQ